MSALSQRHDPPPAALLQVVLDCPLDTCFTYIYQYEPYLKDPVGFPRVAVSLEKHTQPPSPRKFFLH